MLCFGLMVGAGAAVLAFSTVDRASFEAIEKCEIGPPAAAATHRAPRFGRSDGRMRLRWQLSAFDGTPWGACLAVFQACALHGMLYGSPCVVVPGSWRRKVENEEPGIPLVLVQTKLDLQDQAVVSRCRSGP